MAREVVERLLDDINGSDKNVETVQFGIDGAAYEIDLDSDNQRALRDALQLYVGAARRVRGKPMSYAGRGTTKPKVDREQNQAVRDWARKQGIEISERGRIPADVLEAHQRAHATS